MHRLLTRPLRTSRLVRTLVLPAAAMGLLVALAGPAAATPSTSSAADQHTYAADTAGIVPMAYSATCTLRASSPVLSYVSYSGVPMWLLYSWSYIDKGYACQTGKSRLTMQTDGNLVLYDENGTPRWASNTVGRGAFMVFQSDGNLVVYNSSGGAVWASGTCCHSNYNFAVQSDGNLVIYDSGWDVHWATNTNH